MIERHQDYVLRNITVPAGGSVKYVIPLDSDAPFALRAGAKTTSRRKPRLRIDS